MTEIELNGLLQEALTLHQRGQFAEAEKRYRTVLHQNPQNPAALHLLGLLGFQAGQPKAALPLIVASLSLNPGEAAAWNNGGEVLRALGRSNEAESYYREAIRRGPGEASFVSNLGIALQEQNKLADAEDCLRQATVLNSNYAKGWYNLANVLRLRGKLAEAEQMLNRTLTLEPGMPEAWNNLGGVRRGQKRIAEAESCYRRAISLKPRFPEALNNLGACLKDQGRLSEAEAVFRQAVALAPEFSEARSGLAAVYRERGDVREAIAVYEQALTLRPGNMRTLSALMFSEEAVATAPDTARLARARRWGDLHIQSPLFTGRARPAAGRPLRVGYLSADFIQHAVAQFIGALFAAHDPARVEIYVYANVGAPDETTEILRSQVRHWHSIAQLDDAEAAHLMHSHGLDVLLDLNGHTRGSRTQILGYRVAPVQALYLGYFATSGLRTVDYWITDSVLHPNDEDPMFVERLWRLPRCWVAYQPPKNTPEPDWTPDETIRLGSNNHLSKVSPATLDLWAAVLRALPRAQLALKTRHLGDAGTQQRVRDAFKNRGIPSERLVFSGHTPGLANHMGTYRAVDISLDPFPYSGGTTTCDSLWMGVPVVTLAGATMASRMSCSMLQSINATEWIASTADDYVRRVCSLANELAALTPEQRREHRLALRARMARSPLTNAADLARHLEAAYAEMVDRAANPTA